MAHVRSNCSKMSTTYSASPGIFEKIEDYRFTNRKESRADAITELILKGLKYEALLNKKREKMLG